MSSTFRRAAALAAVATLLSAGAAFADTVQADGDAVTPGVQQMVDLGTVAAGAQLDLYLPFTIVCKSTSHLSTGSVVSVDLDSQSVADGGSATATGGTAGPVPAGWPSPGSSCPATGEPSFTGGTPAHVVLTAPVTSGTDLEYTFVWLWSAGDGSMGVAAVTFLLDVVAGGGGGGDSTPPTMSDVPADFTVLTSDPAGAVVSYALPTATDDTDPSPAVACDPAPGTLFPVGATTVTCVATDASGNAATAAFTVTVGQASVVWDAPLRPGNPALVGNLGRTIPVKATLSLGGTVITPAAGAAPSLRVERLGACGGGASVVDTLVVGPMTWDDGRWTWQLDTSALGVGCWRLGLVTSAGATGDAVIELTDAGAGQGSLRGRNRPI